MSSLLKLNLGSGRKILQGYINVDKYGNPDLKFDLETFPWPWSDNSVEEIVLNHVLEHLGESTHIYYRIIQELYRICAPDAVIYIVVPHPRHDDFLIDPSHVRPIMFESFTLFSKASNELAKEKGYANSPLAEYLNVDFEIARHTLILDNQYMRQIESSGLRQEELRETISHAVRTSNNVVKEIQVVLRARKKMT